MAVCKTCNEDFPEKRKEMGYSVCVKCSNEERWSCIQIIHHKTGNETEIVKDREVAEEFMAKSARAGFGALRGMTSTYKRKPTATVTPRKEQKIIHNIFTTGVSRKPMSLDFEGVGKRAVEILENEGYDKAILIVNQAEKEYRLLKKQATQIKEILMIMNTSIK